MAITAPTFHFVTVRVRFSGDTWTTRFRRSSASCTWSSSEAVRRLATTLGYEPDKVTIERVGEAADGDGEVWKIMEVK